MNTNALSDQKPPLVIRRMATIIAELVQRTGACSESDLLQCGFTMSEVYEHADAARDLAAKTLRQLSVV